MRMALARQAQRFERMRRQDHRATTSITIERLRALRQLGVRVNMTLTWRRLYLREEEEVEILEADFQSALKLFSTAQKQKTVWNISVKDAMHNLRRDRILQE